MSTVVSARAPTTGAAAVRPSDLLLVPWMVAGVQTQYEQMRRSSGLEHARVVEIHPSRRAEFLERPPMYSTLRGTIRSTILSSRTLMMRGVTAVWTQVALPMLPFVLTRARLRTPVFYAIDCTPLLLHRFNGHYGGVDDPATLQGKLTSACMRLFIGRCAGLLPWSEWAARSMVRDYGADPDKIRVVPPGIDLDRWMPVEPTHRDRMRLLFVGADFERKGGPLLLDVFRRHLRERCDLRIVTRSAVQPEANVEVHRGLRVGDPKIRQLYQTSDVLVVPTLADCFSMAALEAMACGLPVIISEVGAVPEIVRAGETGILIEPGSGSSLLGAVEAMLASRRGARRLGRAGRARVEHVFNARVQAAATMSFIADTIGGAP